MPPPSQQPESAQPFHSASLYVGDLAPDVNEGLLFEIFNAVGPVASIRVCRDAVTRRSLGYAYINFHQIADAERALDTMNYTMIKTRPCRIMWSQRDPSLRRSGVGNIFVKNLHTSIDNKQLYDTFSLFGNILSCKVVQDRETGGSMGYGYVHYETAEAAHAAIDKLDGMLIDGQEVQVGHFMRRNERPGLNDWTNCYVKNIPCEWDDARLKMEFEKFGCVLSATVAVGIPKAEKKKLNEEVEEKDSKSSLGYGFVAFSDHEGASASVDALNGAAFPTVLDGETTTTELYVSRAQKKAERERELRAKFESLKMDRISKFQGVNLYVKNLDDTVTDDNLRDEFSAMGTITSARVMKDMKDGRSRGFGFVCYSNPEEATRAVNEMNGKLMANKPIYVALAQRKEVRRAQLEAQHSHRGGPAATPAAARMLAPMGNPMYPAAGMPVYMPSARPGHAPPVYPMMPPMMAQGQNALPRPAGSSRYPVLQQQRGVYPMPAYGVLPNQGGRGRPQPGRGGRGRGGPQMRLGVPSNRVPANNQAPPNSIKFRDQARNAEARNAEARNAEARNVNAAPPAPPAPAPAHESLTPSALASASPEVQKNMIGERLYPLIHASQPELAGKITGMLLEMDNSELLHLLESPEALGAKISEALQVLEAHEQQTS